MSVSKHIFSEDTLNNWDQSGKTIVVDTCKKLLENEDATISIPNRKEGLPRAIYEIITAVVKGHVRKEQIKPVLLEMLEWHDEMGSLVVEVISVVELECTTADRANRQRDLLLSLIKILPELEMMCKERHDIDTLGDALIIRNKKNFLTKQIKVRTKMFYKQQKYNLLREESEGYAKLITELNQEITCRVSPQSTIQVVRSLIGTFNLDPNRVLDLIIESLENKPDEHEFFTDLIHLFPYERDTLIEIVGFKLTKQWESGREAKSLFIMIALLIQSNVFALPDIYDWLHPDDESMTKDYNKEMEAAKEYAQKAFVVSTKDKENENKSSKDKNNEEAQAKKEEKDTIYKESRNQKLLLAIAFLQVGAWDNFLELSKRFGENHFVSRYGVSEALCELVLNSVEPFYKSICSNILPSRLKRVESRRVPAYFTFSIVRNVEEIRLIILPILSFLGPYISNNIALAHRILRIATHILKMSKGKKDAFYYDFLTTLDECLLPAVSMLDSNPCIAEQVWEAVKVYPYHKRYKLYGRWKDETYLNHATLIRNRTSVLKRAKYTMMRITKETIKPVSRGIGKQTHNCPAPVFEYILKQVQLYDNLIGPVVDSFKYLTSLSYDVLAFTIVDFLSLCKDRTQNDAMAIAPWLQSLSSFCGSVCKKYTMDLSGILQFVANQLKSDKSIDILVLKDIVQKMGGTDSLENLTVDQLNAMSGGELLKREAGQYLQEKNTKRSSARLKEHLMENNLGIPLLLLMAQQRASIVYKQTETTHVKLVGKLYDQCQDTFIQFGTYLFQMTTIQELLQKMPPIDLLLSKYNLNPDIAFFLSRPLYNHLLQSKFEELRKSDSVDRKQQTSDDKKRIFITACDTVYQPMINSIRTQLPAKVWEEMEPSFFLNFWLLTMSDLQVPTKIYEKEVKRLADLPTSKLRKREIERISSLKEKLEDEKRRQLEHVDRVSAFVEQKSQTWFSQRTAKTLNTVTTFLQLCIFPRCTFSTPDAIYCANFVKMLHRLKTPNFSTLLCYDKMFCDITYTVTSCTEQEAHHYAKFLLCSLGTVMHWHSSAENFEKECANYPGFITRYRISTKEANDYVDYENFRHVVHKWHYKITKALVTCLESGDYIQIKNAILVLQGILPRFPVIVNLAPVISKRIEKVKTTEKNHRNDLFVLANSYLGRLKAKRSSMIPESDFHIVRKPEPPAKETGTKDSQETASKPTETNAEMNGEVEIIEENKTKSEESAEKRVSESDDKKKREKRKESEKETKDSKKKGKKREEMSENETSVDMNSTNGSVKTDEKERASKRRKQEPDSKNRKEESKKSSKEAEDSPKDAKKREKRRVASASPDQKKLRRSQKSS